MYSRNEIGTVIYLSNEINLFPQWCFNIKSLTLFIAKTSRERMYT